MLIKVHSFIDVITNSSTEIYVCADEGTIKSIKELVDTILKLGGSDKVADDLFIFKLVDINLEDAKSDYMRSKARNELDGEIPKFYDMPWDARQKLIDEKVDSYGDLDPTEQDDFDEYYNDNYGYSKNIQVEVTPKDDSKESQLVAGTLANLTSLFNIDAEYN